MFQETTMHSQQLQNLLDHINMLQLDSQKFHSQTITSPTAAGKYNILYQAKFLQKRCRLIQIWLTDGRRESQSRPRTPSQSPGATVSAMLDQSGNIILYETQRGQQSGQDGKRGMISQLFEKVRKI